MNPKRGNMPRFLFRFAGPFTSKKRTGERDLEFGLVNQRREWRGNLLK
jgi:hypothetical protein